MRFLRCLTFFTFLAFGTSLAHAGSVLTSVGSGKVVEEVKTSPEVKVLVSGRGNSLKLVGAGLRFKKVAFIKAKVYVGELFAVDPAKVKKSADEALASIADQKAIALRMTFLRDVDGEKVSGGFKEALEVNKIALDDVNVKAFLEAVKKGGEAKDKKTLVVVGEKLAGGKEVITYENAAGGVVSIEGGEGWVRKIFSIWFGKIDDSGLESLKKEILGE